MNFYEELELERGASTEDIERVFRQLARQVHPDLNSGDPRGAEARMKLLNEIRDTLTDPVRRLLYDASLDASAAPTSPVDEAVPRPTSDEVTETRAGGRSWWPRVWFAAGAGAITAAVFIAAHPTSYDTASPAAGADAALVTDAPPLLTTPTRATATHADEGTGSNGAPRGSRVVVRIGTRAEDVLKRLGAPEHVEAGPRDGVVVFRYGRLRLELTGGRVTGGDAVR